MSGNNNYLREEYIEKQLLFFLFYKALVNFLFGLWCFISSVIMLLELFEKWASFISSPQC